jgi:NAD(P)-dependent dehydrogenase (short-subunit alcohol dehydrogenase family)
VNEGAYVFVTGRRDPELAAAVKEIGRNVTGIQGDVSNLGDLDRLFAQIEREKGKLDIVFANAGIAKYAPFGTITEEFYDSIFNIQCEGPPVHGAESAAAAAGGRLDHPECLHRRRKADAAIATRMSAIFPSSFPMYCSLVVSLRAPALPSDLDLFDRNDQPFTARAESQSAPAGLTRSG